MLLAISDPESLTAPSAEAADETSATFDLLANRRRRLVLRRLAESDAPVSVDDLVDHVVLAEDGSESRSVASVGDAVIGTRRRVRLSLHHVHLPKLAEANVVDVDSGSHAVSLGENGSGLLGRLTRIDE
ncbi:hypothetical protein C491_20886 [Natronococcus amylolyticus DSM 10524]|uniref:DUF7344 domain-containing protein n=1 Tax=Natronococcus amylolyticus DSM 10524 TaxID=1227497 RepID=L9WWC5_9EURY|nr:hypothetical protein [Natronococcus amylolyticus]ELY53804.1 hypothetical protein C491_20886 [Natronococcus amylolyticus DSM 10524]